MRLMVDKYVGRSASLGSPGLDNIRWLAPVRAGDTITYRRTITGGAPLGEQARRSAWCSRAGKRSTSAAKP